jgi:hypothetical protein
MAVVATRREKVDDGEKRIVLLFTVHPPALLTTGTNKINYKIPTAESRF